MSVRKNVEAPKGNRVDIEWWWMTKLGSNDVLFKIGLIPLEADSAALQHLQLTDQNKKK